MNLYLQAMSYCNSVEAAGLLRVPVPGINRGCQIRMSSGGRLSVRQFDSIAGAVQLVQVTKFNQVELTVFGCHESYGVPGHVTSIAGVRRHSFPGIGANQVLDDQLSFAFRVPVSPGGTPCL